MGELIVLAEHRADRSRPTRSARPAFFFDLSDPFSYLAAEQVERTLGDVEWIPAAGTLLRQDGVWSRRAAIRAQAETLAVAQRLPLVWPEHFPADTPAALRAAAYAAEVGVGSRFALAASRLAFCGGFNLEDPEILAEAAAAAGLGLKDCFVAAGDLARDCVLLATTRGLLHHGVTRLPAIRCGKSWFSGDEALTGAAALLRARAV